MSPTTKTQQLIRLKNEYRAAHENAPGSLDTILDWGIETGRYELDLKKARKRAAEELGEALRSEVTTDAHGHEIRVNLAFETEQGWLWDQRDTITRPNMELNVSHARRMVYSDIRATVLSVNDYNERHPDEAPIQFSLNFAGDLADDGIPIPSSTELEQLVEHPPVGLADLAPRLVRARPSSPPSDRA